MTPTQHDLWNGAAGRAWVELQEPLDAMFAPFTGLLVQAAESHSGGRVLDIGCGTGTTTMAMADAVGATPPADAAGSTAPADAAGATTPADAVGATSPATGVDISEAMLELARQRARNNRCNVDFVCADAQYHRFDHSSYDLVVSRFGVMFFADPAAAMANIRTAARHGARLRFITWRTPAENSFMTTAERAAAPLLPALPERDPRAPGQFALSDPELLRGLLSGAGWNRVDVTPVEAECELPLEAFDRYVTTMGPVGVALRSAEDNQRARLLAVLQAAFEPFRHGDVMRFEASCWVADAVAD